MTLQRGGLRKQRKLRNQSVHGYHVSPDARGMFASKPANSPSAVIAGVESFGKCQGPCQRDHQVLFNGRCVDCRFYQLSMEGNDT